MRRIALFLALTLPSLAYAQQGVTWFNGSTLLGSQKQWEADGTTLTCVVSGAKVVCSSTAVGGVTSVTDDGRNTLTIAPNTGAVLAGINLTNPNTWTGASTWQFNNSTGASWNVMLTMSNTSAATAILTQKSPAIEWSGFYWNGSASTAMNAFAGVTFYNGDFSVPSYMITNAALTNPLWALSLTNGRVTQFGDLNMSSHQIKNLTQATLTGDGLAAGRLVSTTSPLTGGGDLTADRTIACPTCVTSGGGTSLTLANTYANGANTADSTMLLDSTRGPVVVKDNAAPIGTLLQGVTNGGANIFLFDANDLIFGQAEVIQTTTGKLTLQGGGVSGTIVQQTVQTTGSPTTFTVTGPAHTTLTIAEQNDVNFNLARTVNFAAGGGTIATQRAVLFQAPTYSATTNAVTLTTAANVTSTGAPVASTNVTIGAPLSFWSQSGKSRFEIDSVGTSSALANIAVSVMNNTAAALNAQQFSPMDCIEGNGWSTTNSASRNVRWCWQTQPVQGAANPTGNLQLGISVNAGDPITDVFLFKDSGVLESQTNNPFVLQSDVTVGTGSAIAFKFTNLNQTTANGDKLVTFQNGNIEYFGCVANSATSGPTCTFTGSGNQGLVVKANNTKFAGFMLDESATAGGKQWTTWVPTSASGGRAAHEWELYDGSNVRIGVTGSQTTICDATSLLSLTSTDPSGTLGVSTFNIATAQTIGLSAFNAKPSTVSATVQYSPVLELAGHVWNTGGTPADNWASWGFQLVPTSSGAPTNQLNLMDSTTTTSTRSWTTIYSLFDNGTIESLTNNTFGFKSDITMSGTAIAHSFTTKNPGTSGDQLFRIQDTTSDVVNLYSNAGNPATGQFVVTGAWAAGARMAQIVSKGSGGTTAAVSLDGSAAAANLKVSMIATTLNSINAWGLYSGGGVHLYTFDFNGLMTVRTATGSSGLAFTASSANIASVYMMDNAAVDLANAGIQIKGGAGGVASLVGGGAGGPVNLVGGAGGAAATSHPAGAGGTFGWTAGAGGAATSTASGTAANGGTVTLTAGAGGTGATSTNGPGTGGNIAIVSGAAGSTSGGFSGANSGDVTLDVGAKSGTGVNGNVKIGTGTNAPATVQIGQAGTKLNIGDIAIGQATNVNTGVTANGSSVIITTQTATTAAVSVETGFTLTNSTIASTSSVVCGVSDYSGTYHTNGIPWVTWDTIAAGSVKLHVANIDATNPLNGTIKIHCTID